MSELSNPLGNSIRRGVCNVGKSRLGPGALIAQPGVSEVITTGQFESGPVTFTNPDGPFAEETAVCGPFTVTPDKIATARGIRFCCVRKHIMGVDGTGSQQRSTWRVRLGGVAGTILSEQVYGVVHAGSLTYVTEMHDYLIPFDSVAQQRVGTEGFFQAKTEGASTGDDADANSYSQNPMAQNIETVDFSSAVDLVLTAEVILNARAGDAITMLNGWLEFR